ncbi:MAG: hypothetical protein JKX70_09910 [Phycisphaerales bacterium]|nr:hypothetical protein [Phycisphaerales bacterium]
MTGAINNLAASLSGAPVSSAASSKAKAEETFKAAYKRKLIKDEYNTQVEEIEHIDAMRSLADADQEDAKEDRQEHQTGYPEYQRALKDRPKRLDLNA